MELVVAVLVAALFASILVAVVPPDRVRAYSLLSVLAILMALWNPVAPSQYREAAIWGAVSILVISLFAKRHGGHTSSVIPLLTFLFFGITFITTALLNSAGLGASLRLGILGLLGALVSSQFSTRDRETFLNGLIAFGVAEALLGGAEYFADHAPLLWGYGLRNDGTEAIYRNPIWFNSPRIQGSLGHPIPFALILAAAFLLLITRWRTLPKGRALFALIVLACGLVLAGTRSALLGTIVALLYFAVLSAGTRHRIRNGIFAFITMGAAVLINLQLDVWLDGVQATGSFTNRLGALTSVPGLLGRSFTEVWFGSGWGSESDLFATGYLQQNGFGVVDNQLVSTLATQGLIGLLLLLFATVLAFVRADPTKRALIIFMGVMWFSFDYLRWPVISSLLFVILALPSWQRRRAEEAPRSAVKPEVQSRRSFSAAE